MTIGIIALRTAIMRRIEEDHAIHASSIDDEIGKAIALAKQVPVTITGQYCPDLAAKVARNLSEINRLHDLLTGRDIDCPTIEYMNTRFNDPFGGL